MRTKINFYDLKMLIFHKSEKAAYYYCELMYIIYDKPYCRLFFSNKKKNVIEMSITTLMEYLPESVFLMCKRSAIVNLCYLKHLKHDEMTIEMSDGVKFPLSKANIMDFNLMIEKVEDISPYCPDCFACKPTCKKQPLFCRRNTAPPPTIP